MRSSRVMAPVSVALATLAALSAAPLAAGPAFASPAAATGAPSADQPRESIAVTGRGVVSGEPDTLVANFAVETSGSTVADALQRANTAATRVRDALVRGGVAKADLQTSDVSITARRDDAQVITGYTVSQGVTARLRNLPKAGALMTAAITAGGDAARLNGVSFEIEDDTALLAQARKRAFADARAKAELYAREAGRPLGRVVEVREETPGRWGGGDSKSMSVADFAMPIEPGRQQLAVTVTVEWALDPPLARPAS